METKNKNDDVPTSLLDDLYKPILYDSELIHILVVTKETFDVHEEIERLSKHDDIASYYQAKATRISRAGLSSFNFRRNGRIVNVENGFKHPSLHSENPPFLTDTRHRNVERFLCLQNRP